MELTWAKLMPPAIPVQNLKAKSFLAGATPFPGAGSSEPPPPPTIDDKRWLSEKRLQPGAGAAPAVVPELDGKRVRIGGYVVPLDFEATNVKEFLLVPFVGACIHVPPPPPNQIIYVKSAKGFDVQGSFDPVYVTGTIKVASQYTGLAETGYSIDAGEGRHSEGIGGSGQKLKLAAGVTNGHFPLILSFSPWEKGRCVNRPASKLRPERATAFPLHPHPLADADTLRCKLAKASLRGEVQGRFAQFITHPASCYRLCAFSGWRFG